MKFSLPIIPLKGRTSSIKMNRLQPVRLFGSNPTLSMKIVEREIVVQLSGSDNMDSSQAFHVAQICEGFNHFRLAQGQSSSANLIVKDQMIVPAKPTKGEKRKNRKFRSESSLEKPKAVEKHSELDSEDNSKPKQSTASAAIFKLPKKPAARMQAKPIEGKVKAINQNSEDDNVKPEVVKPNPELNSDDFPFETLPVNLFETLTISDISCGSSFESDSSSDGEFFQPKKYENLRQEKKLKHKKEKLWERTMKMKKRQSLQE